MCGIFGVLGRKKIDFNRNLLPHRGPDGWGLVHLKYNQKWLSLFQSRLSIIGLGEQGLQPYQKYVSYTLAYNGEIYNYKELKNILVEKYQVKFISETDTEVLYESIINLGIDKTLEYINGIFAFIFFDKKMGGYF